MQQQRRHRSDRSRCCDRVVHYSCHQSRRQHPGWLEEFGDNAAIIKLKPRFGRRSVLWEAVDIGPTVADDWLIRNSAQFGRVVDTTVQRLRGKIEHDPKTPAVLITVRGFGYRLARET